MTCIDAFHQSATFVQDLVEEMLFDSLPRQNVAEVEVKKLRNDRSSQMFLRALRDDGGRWPRVRVTWHLAGGVGQRSWRPS